MTHYLNNPLDEDVISNELFATIRNEGFLIVHEDDYRIMKNFFDKKMEKTAALISSAQRLIDRLD